MKTKDKKEVKDKSEYRMSEIRSLISRGKADGYITVEEVSDTLSELDLNKEQVENIFKALDNLDIDIVDEKETDLITDLEKNPIHGLKFR